LLRAVCGKIREGHRGGPVLFHGTKLRFPAADSTKRNWKLPPGNAPLIHTSLADSRRRFPGSSQFRRVARNLSAAIALFLPNSYHHRGGKRCEKLCYANSLLLCC
jgi:hypothetical protein